MSKIVVPGSTFTALQEDPGLQAGVITSFGAVYQYSYAFSQLILGALAIRYNGIRILLVGCLLFGLGTLGFPLTSNPVWMLVARGVTGCGSGTVFVGTMKLLLERYPKLFGLVMGMGYVGALAGGTPIVYCIEKFTWRVVLMAQGGLSLLLWLIIVVSSYGLLGMVRQENAFSQLKKVLLNRQGQCLFFSSSLVFGVYYVIMTTMGQKCLMDFAGFSSIQASLVISFLSVLLALLNFLGDTVLKLCHNNGRRLTIFASTMNFIAPLFIALIFYLRLPGWSLLIAFLMAAIPAGFFSIYSMIAKGFYEADLLPTSVVILNCAAFIAIAMAGNIVGIVLSHYESAKTGLSYPPQAYGMVFLILSFIALLGVVVACRLKGTKTQP